MSDEYKCCFCGKGFTMKCNRITHENYRCKRRNENKSDDKKISKNELNNNYLLLISKHDLLQNTYNLLLDNYEILKKENIELKNESRELRDKFTQLATSGAKTAEKSVSALSYAIKKYDTAPKLDPIEGKEIKQLMYDTEEIKSNKNSKYPAEEHVLYKFRNNKLEKFFGKMIIDCKKSKDPRKQSMWNVDRTRIRYIIRELEGKGVKWVRDNDGVKITELIIEPIAQHIKTMMKKYISELQKNKDNIDSFKIMSRQMDAQKIIEIINDESFQKKVLNYITPFFYLNSQSKQSYEKDFDTNDKINYDSSDSEKIIKSKYQKK